MTQVTGVTLRFLSLLLGVVKGNEILEKTTPWRFTCFYNALQYAEACTFVKTADAVFIRKKMAWSSSAVVQPYTVNAQKDNNNTNNNTQTRTLETLDALNYPIGALIPLTPSFLQVSTLQFYFGGDCRRDSWASCFLRPSRTP